VKTKLKSGRLYVLSRRYSVVCVHKIDGLWRWMPETVMISMPPGIPVLFIEESTGGSHGIFLHEDRFVETLLSIVEEFPAIIYR